MRGYSTLNLDIN